MSGAAGRVLQVARLQDSNPQPLGPKPSALSIELQAQFPGDCTRIYWGEQRDSNP